MVVLRSDQGSLDLLEMALEVHLEELRRLEVHLAWRMEVLLGSSYRSSEVAWVLRGVLRWPGNPET